jgi:hypothetical protein
MINVLDPTSLLSDLTTSKPMTCIKPLLSSKPVSSKASEWIVIKARNNVHVNPNLRKVLASDS